MATLNHLDGYVSPLCFCHIRLAEGLFINAYQFFSKISNSVESSATIAKGIGESVFYTDKSGGCFPNYRISGEQKARNLFFGGIKTALRRTNMAKMFF